MTIAIRQVEPDQIEELIPVLLLAEHSERALRWGLAHLVDAMYLMDQGDELVGAATMQWRDDPCEIMELAIRPEFQGQGFGTQFVAWLIAEARHRNQQQMLVGTAKSSIDNIVFYQKCGFRMDHVRQDYFWYYSDPLYENGIRTLDMLVFRYDLIADGHQAKRRRRK